jgi:chorismate mutase/prephenate dehydrogenase
MGARFASELAARGHAIDILEPGDPRPEAEVVAAADIVMLAVPMRLAAARATALGPHVRPDALLCDINSLKVEVCAAAASASRGEVLGLHPMFGPSVHTLDRQKLVVCRVRDGQITNDFLAELAALGLALFESTPEIHDRMMAVVQVLTHFRTLVMGEALRRVGVGIEESLDYTSPIYRLELAVVGRLFVQDPDLYAEIEMQNPFGDEVRKAFRDAATDVSALIETADREGFRTMFAGVRSYFGPFGEEAHELSDSVIDLVAAQK